MLARMLGLGWALALFVAARLGVALVFEWPRPTLQCGVSGFLRPRNVEY